MESLPMEPCISVIVPIYRVEPYLDHCIFTIVNQSYKNLEIILVDDGSPDGCPQLCDSWAQRDKRIKVIHKVNGGLSDARNAGIEAAEGDYLLFIDGDDYISLDMCRLLLNEALVERADIACCNLYWTYPDGRRRPERMDVADAPRVFSGVQMVERYFGRHSVDMVVVWNKLFRRELFFSPERIRFPKGRYHEDGYITYRLYNSAARIAFIPDKLYYYVQRSGSIMSQYNNKNLQDTLECIKEQLSWAEKQPEAIRNNVAKEALETLFAMEYRISIDKELDAGYIEQCCQYLMKHAKISGNPSIDSKTWLKWKLHCWHLLLPAWKIWRIGKRILGKEREP